MEDLIKIWSDCADILLRQDIIDKVSYDTFFKPSKIQSIDNSKVIITTEFQFTCPALLERKQQIESVLTNLLNRKVEIEVLSEDDYKSLYVSNESSNFDNEDNLNEAQTFDNFIVGSSNRMAQNASLAVATSPGNSFNPLFLYSNPGLGKTHLLNAIGNYAKERNPKLRVKYVTSKNFVDEIVNRTKNNKSDEIYLKYSSIDLLLIDDIQFLFGKQKSSEMFFHIFNEIISNNKQIVITSDKKPEDLVGFEDRLVSRFKSGLSFGIDPPEFETAKAILEKKIEMDNTQLIIQDDVVNFMAVNFCNDIRSLEGSVKRLYFCAIVYNKSIVDLDFALEIFKDESVVKNPNAQLTKDTILKTTADYYYLSTDQLISKNRSQKLTTPREICMYLMRDLLDITYAEIGLFFGGRDHSTVMKAYSRVEKKLKNDKDYQSTITKLKEKLGTF